MLPTKPRKCRTCRKVKPRSEYGITDLAYQSRANGIVDCTECRGTSQRRILEVAKEIVEATDFSLHFTLMSFTTGKRGIWYHLTFTNKGVADIHGWREGTLYTLLEHIRDICSDKHRRRVCPKAAGSSVYTPWKEYAHWSSTDGSYAVKERI